MKAFIPCLIYAFFFLSCKTNINTKEAKSINSVEIKTLLADTLLNIRALEVTKQAVYAATSKGEFYKLNLTDTVFNKVSFLHKKANIDTIGNNNFRALAVVNASNNKIKQDIFAITIASPAKLYKNGELVYQENNEKAFYDALAFWNNQEGIAIGDPTDACMSIIITRNGGETWEKINCSLLPEKEEGEAAFAASDTNIAIKGDKTWVATGGKSSRILFSPDKGKTWEVYNTPIVQGLETTGMYSLAFYDAKNGFAIGGDYTKPEANTANKIRTKDGGKTWQLVVNTQNPGYRSCVQYVPNSNAKKLVAIGFKGIDYSADAGNTWKHLSDSSFYTIRFVNDSIAYAAGNGRISKLTFR
ncbi:MAG: WD40/YVTN/BNR-like repeat-containing protein [Oceanihabitans sp.]